MIVHIFTCQCYSHGCSLSVNMTVILSQDYYCCSHDDGLAVIVAVTLGMFYLLLNQHSSYVSSDIGFVMTES